VYNKTVYEPIYGANRGCYCDLGISSAVNCSISQCSPVVNRSAPSPPDSEVNVTPAGSTIESCPVSPKFMEFPLRVSSASCAKNCEVGSMGSMVCVIDKIIYPARYF
jgi:hypothetical protein